MKKKLILILTLLTMLLPFLAIEAQAGELDDGFDDPMGDPMDPEMMEDLPEDYDEEEVERARVLEVEEAVGPAGDDEFYNESLAVRLEILSGENRGEEIDAVHTLTGNLAYDMHIEPGDRVLISTLEIGGVSEVFIIEYERDRIIYIILGVFVLLLLILGGLKGLKTILTLGLTLLLMLGVLIPGLLAGYSPVLLTIGISIVVTIFTLLVVGGLNSKSYSAIIGVLGGVFIAGMIAFVVGGMINLTGLSGPEASMLMYIPQEVNFDFSGLLFAGIIMGALGAVMDVGMSIASAMEEIRQVDPSISTKKLILAGMNVGKDIMGTMANTLILAYVGSMIPLLLLFAAYQQPYVSIINMDIVATEVIRALSGSIGLILTIPLTAITSGLLRDKLNPQTTVEI